jgi:hypothetical protein
MQLKIQYLVFSLLIVTKLSVGQEIWIVPAEHKENLSPFEFNDNTQKTGEEIYLNNCKSCHGLPGQNNYLQLVPIPGDPATSKFQNNTDGELFYKISTGRISMPEFKNQLIPEDIWNVISYIRKTNKDYVQKVGELKEKKGYDGDIFIQFAYLLNDNQIKATLKGIKGNQSENLENVDLKLFAERKFGKLPLDEIKTTNSQGNAFFAIPERLPGDSNGYINIIAELADIELFGRISQDSLMAIGMPINLPGLTEERAMWNRVNKAPLWVIFAYAGGVLMAWGFIIYILLQLRTIFYIGKKESVA